MPAYAAVPDRAGKSAELGIRNHDTCQELLNEAAESPKGILEPETIEAADRNGAYAEYKYYCSHNSMLFNAQKTYHLLVENCALNLGRHPFVQ